MKKNSFFKDSFILTIANLTTGILKFLFDVILSQKLGAEVVGLYGIIMPIYDLFICLVSGGMIAAISKISAEHMANNDFHNLNKTVDTAMGFNLIWGSLIISFVFFNSNFISQYILKDPRASTSLKVICPAILAISISSILKGYFYGISKVKIPAAIDVSEKFLRVSFLIILIYILTDKGITNTVTSPYITLAVGEVLSTILLYLFYKIYKRRYNYKNLPSERRPQLLFNVLIISLPLCITTFLTTGLSAIAALIVPRALTSAGFNYSTALELIGKFNQMSLNIILFPMVVINSISTVLIPDLSQSISNKNYWAAEDRILSVLKLSLVLGLCTLMVCLAIPENLGIMFFKRYDLGSYILFASLCSPFLYMSATTYSILNALGKQGIILRNSLLVATEQIILLFILVRIPWINIYGYGLSLIITSITSLILNMFEIKKFFYLSFKGTDFLITILLFILTFFILNILKNLLPNCNLKYIFIIFVAFSLLFTSKKFIVKSNE